MIALKSNIDTRGVLVAVENGADLPFEINRFFLVVGMNEAPRGFHAHRILHELVICARGSCRIVTDDGTTRREWFLDRADEGLHLPPMHWIELRDFSTDCVLTVLASDAYDDAEYIRDYPTFVAAVGTSRAR
jgi:dTDP-4-dehydrorhamnose 3,5-epimerase-like enzyme